MTNIVERLEALSEAGPTMLNAAREIKQLRADLADCRGMIEAWKDKAERRAAFIKRLTFGRKNET